MKNLFLALILAQPTVAAERILTAEKIICAKGSYMMALTQTRHTPKRYEIVFAQDGQLIAEYEATASPFAQESASHKANGLSLDSFRPIIGSTAGPFKVPASMPFTIVFQQGDESRGLGSFTSGVAPYQRDEPIEVAGFDINGSNCRADN